MWCCCWLRSRLWPMQHHQDSHLETWWVGIESSQSPPSIFAVNLDGATSANSDCVNRHHPPCMNNYVFKIANTN
ncbi:hypothetical protein Sjap_001422 [Stephania japonica]|uniref:Uncharacterized protein n=1 Tax=Stephania japonica TaxID=461633 RepID=A0AAP0KJY0_9MAGN